MPKLYRLDADMNGTDSIQPYIDAGKVVNLECPTFEEFDKHRLMLQQTVKPGDFVGLDTGTKMLSTTRADRQLGNDPGAKLWDPVKVAKYFGDKEYLAVYNMATQLMMRGLMNLRARGAHIILSMHEDEVMDSMAGLKMAGPQANEAAVREITGSSSDIFRLVSLTDDVNNAEGVTIFPAGTRVLYLRRSDAYTAKFHVARERSDKIPKALPNPTLPALWETLGKVSSWLTLYGHPGSGKTSLMATATDDPVRAATKTINK